MPLLLHICCAPCSVACIRLLREEGTEPVGYWYNPNIHPYLEYKARRDTLRQYAGDIGLDLREHEEYGLRPFTAAVAGDPEHRCGYCYTCRLEDTARYAAANGFTHFSTTLLISPYQDRELICAVGAQMGARWGVEFVPYDFRPRFRAGQEEARAGEHALQLSLYQKAAEAVFGRPVAEKWVWFLRTGKGVLL